jgi:hypothetical protein
MKVNELKVGCVVNLNYLRHYDFARCGRVEAVGYDWAVVRTDKGLVDLLHNDEDYELTSWE